MDRCKGMAFVLEIQKYIELQFFDFYDMKRDLIVAVREKKALSQKAFQ